MEEKESVRWNTGGDRMEYESRSYQGSRQINEDCVAKVQKDGKYCFILCDGLGGHGKGEVASRLAADTIGEIFMERPEFDNLERMLQAAQDRILEQQKESGKAYEMKTTAVVLMADGKQARWIHIGDSRLYRFRKAWLGMKFFRTFDHSVPQMLAASGKIKEKDIRHHEDRSRLLRVLGVQWESPRYEAGKLQNTEEGEAFLLCSDGWWELIDEKDMMKTLKRAGSVAEWMDAMEQIILEHGKGTDMDNFSAVGVWI